MNDQDTDPAGLLADKLDNADMLVDDYESFNNDRQDAEPVAIINPEDPPTESADTILANDCTSIHGMLSHLLLVSLFYPDCLKLLIPLALSSREPSMRAENHADALLLQTAA